MADLAWLGGEDLAENVLIEESEGILTRVEPSGESAGAERLPGVVLPGLVNTHSHAFHRLLRGRTHRRGDDFWAWRELMYRVAGELNPETYEQIARAVFVEMAMAGITSVGEFHYLHHGPDGEPYSDVNEMGHRIIRAARSAGLRIALLDAGYFTSGFDHGPLNPAQRRFSDGSVEHWLDRVEQLLDVYEGDPHVRVGLAPHSVRAVPPRDLERLSERLSWKIPIHIHVSEQPSENEACREVTGLSPAQLLDRTGLLGPDTTVVHATHVTQEDITILGDAGVGVCYCATTERELADGIGPADRLRAAGCTLSVGSDSHAVIDLMEEARGIEMHTRLRTGRRGTFAPSELLEAATTGGARALGLMTGTLEPGNPADFILIRPDTPRMAGVEASGGVGQIVFSATASDVIDVLVGGERIVSGGLHPEWDEARSTLVRMMSLA